MEHKKKTVIMAVKKPYILMRFLKVVVLPIKSAAFARQKRYFDRPKAALLQTPEIQHATHNNNSIKSKIMKTKNIIITACLMLVCISINAQKEKGSN